MRILRHHVVQDCASLPFYRNQITTGMYLTRFEICFHFVKEIEAVWRITHSPYSRNDWPRFSQTFIESSHQTTVGKCLPQYCTYVVNTVNTSSVFLIVRCWLIFVSSGQMKKQILVSTSAQKRKLPRAQSKIDMHSNQVSTFRLCMDSINFFFTTK